MRWVDGFGVLLASALITGGTASGATLIAHYSFDVDFSDGSGNGLDLSPHGTPTIAAGGQFGSALDLDGNASGDFLFHADDDLFDVPGSISIAAWVRTSVSGQQMVVSKHFDGTNRNYDLRVATGGVPLVALIDTAGVGHAISDSGVISDGEWHHVGSTYDHSTGTWKLFVDGALTTTLTPGALSLGNADAQFRVGAYAFSDTTDLVQGQIDEVYLFEGALTDAEMISLATINALPVPEPGAVPLLASCAAFVLGRQRSRRRQS